MTSTKGNPFDHLTISAPRSNPIQEAIDYFIEYAEGAEDETDLDVAAEYAVERVMDYVESEIQSYLDGIKNDVLDLRCKTCEGDGNIDCEVCEGAGVDPDSEDGDGCSNCDSDGVIHCPDCEGSGNWFD